MKYYSIIGSPLSHTLSPILHNYWFKKYKVEAEYTSLEIKKEEIEKVIIKIREEKINGINITLPYKQEVIPFIDKLVNDAKKTNSVNTIYLNSENLIIGDNTDVFGLQAAYFKEIADTNMKNKKALVLGAGGVAPSVILALNKSNIKNVFLSNRTHHKTLFLKKKFPNIQIVHWDKLEKVISSFDIVINATSLGLKNGSDFNFVINDSKKSMIYIDTIYNPLETKMIKHLNHNGVKTYNGLYMFIYQAQKSFYMWTKINPEIDSELINLLTSKLK
jgi:shikimate dehydrogenase|tara:strand:+ start:399 stop:1223 length:825 start_codon:yes stop_codon:yes gene_type:complete